MRYFLKECRLFLANKIFQIKLFGLKVFYDLPVCELEKTFIGIDLKKKTPKYIDDICIPPYKGSKDCDDYSVLINIVQYLKPKIILEFGTAHGNTVANLCNSIPNSEIFTVNALLEQQTGDATTFSLTMDEIGRVYRKYGFKNRVSQIYENTLRIDLSKYFKTDSVDLTIIDACHDTDFVINDFCKVVPYIKKGGIVLLHDTFPVKAGHLLGSYIACMKLRHSGFDIRHIANTWWGIWIKP